MKSWWGAYVFIMCLWSHAYTQEIANGWVECYAGSIRCNEGYLYTKDNPSFHCGQAEQGECRQHIWTGEEVNETMAEEGFPLPRKPTTDWSVCMTGAPTQFTRFSINFVSAQDRIKISHFNVRMSRGNHGPVYDQSVVINDAVLGVDGEYDWGEEDIFHPVPYPFAVGKQFTVKIVANDPYRLTYYANGKQVATRTLQTSVSEVVKVTVNDDVDITKINVWCGGDQ